jgi:hypothetical protein
LVSAFLLCSRWVSRHRIFGLVFFSRSGATAVSGDDVLRSSLDFRHRHANRDSISSWSTRQRSPEGTL